jgi:hypothetical protein
MGSIIEFLLALLQAKAISEGYESLGGENRCGVGRKEEIGMSSTNSFFILFS